jgi:CheY-like chemotaxis protein
MALLVSRDQSLEEHCASRLRALGYSVESTDDSRVGLAMAMTRRPAVVIVALDVSQRVGLELCDLLRCDPVTRALPVAAVVDDMRRAREARAAGISGVVVSPSGEAEWRAALAAAAPMASSVPPPSVPPPSVPSSARRRRAAANVMERSITPPQPPPALHCPRCGGPLQYLYSDIGGAERREQWDRFSCGGCGEYQYRPRTRKLSAVTWLER